MQTRKIIDKYSLTLGEEGNLALKKAPTLEDANFLINMTDKHKADIKVMLEKDAQNRAALVSQMEEQEPDADRQKIIQMAIETGEMQELSNKVKTITECLDAKKLITYEREYAMPDGSVMTMDVIGVA